MPDRVNKFQKALQSGFALTVEIAPPKGTAAPKSLRIAREIAGRVDGVNVTDNQRGVVRMSSMAFSRLLLDEGCEPIMQLTCRDRNRLSLQSELIGAYGLGIRTICLMTGDHPTMGDNPEAKTVYDLDVYQLIKMAGDYGKGMNIHGKPMKNAPDFFIGAVANPFYEPMELEELKMIKKIHAGAQFFQTQPFFDTDSLEAFLEHTGDIDTKILAGVTPIKSVKMLDFLNENVLTQPIPDSVAERIRSANDPAREGLTVAAEFISDIKDRVDGIHLMPIGQVEAIPALLDMIEAG